MITDWKVGDTINICSSITAFCGSSTQGLIFKDKNISKNPDLCSISPGSSTCQISIDNIGLNLKLVKGCNNNNNPTKIYRDLGTFYTNPNGQTGVQFIVSNSDLADYIDSSNNYKVMVAIVDGKGQNIIELSSCSLNINITENLPSEYTDTIKVHIKPWGWYTPDQAANKIVLNLTDISGAISNYISSITGYTYVKTEVTTEGNYVILNIRLKNISTLAEPISISLGTLILILAVTIIVIFGVITFIEWYTEVKPDTPKESRVATPGEQKSGTIEASNDANSNCLTGLPLNPTCDQIKTYAICLDSVHIGLYGTLKSEYPNSKEVETKYNEYLNKYESISNTCTNPSETLAQIIAEKSKYLIDLSTTFDNLQKDYESNLCWIPSPISDGCLLSAKAGKTVIVISGILAVTYLIYKSKK